MPPVPVGPVSMHGHQRRESTHSTHAETGPSSHLGHGQRGGMRNSVRGGGHQGYGQNSHQNYQQNHQYNNSYSGRNGGYGGGPNQNRGPPPSMGQQSYGGPAVQGYPNSPRNIHRSPAMPHASPSLPTVPIVTNQLYPLHQQQYMPPSSVSSSSLFEF
jgi:hypothetical protein